MTTDWRSNVDAWIVAQYVARRPQTVIARNHGTSPAMVSIAIRRFCWDWTSIDVADERMYDEDRRRQAKLSLWFYLMENDGKLGNPNYHSGKDVDVYVGYGKARDEHSFLLRAEGLTYQAIADRLGVTRDRARQMVYKRGRQIKWGVRKANWLITLGDGLSP